MKKILIKLCMFVPTGTGLFSDYPPLHFTNIIIIIVFNVMMMIKKVQNQIYNIRKLN